MAPEDLIKEAIVAQKRAEAPYSNYPVGVALLTIDNSVILGCNIESKAYPTTLCAERVAIFSAISQGYKDFSAMALITQDGASPNHLQGPPHVFAIQIPSYHRFGSGRPGWYAQTMKRHSSATSVVIPLLLSTVPGWGHIWVRRNTRGLALFLLFFSLIINPSSQAQPYL